MAPAGVNAGGRMENRIRRNLAAGVILSAPPAAGLAGCRRAIAPHIAAADGMLRRLAANSSACGRTGGAMNTPTATRAALISLAMLTTPLGGETHPQEQVPSLAVLATSGQLPESGTDRRVARGGARLAPVIRQHAAEGGRERGSAAGRY